jgi:hypothetical protein
MSNSRPLLVGLCGYPKVGKSTVQNILREDYGLIPVDDGRPLRDIGKLLFGLSEEHVTTQEGKASYVEIEGKTWQVRDILGTLGDLFENTFGQQTIPTACIRQSIASWKVQPDESRPYYYRGYSFGSVRKVQGKSYRDAGGEVIEITRAGCGPSGYAFDEYDRTLITKTIHNPVPLGAEPTPENLERLRAAIRAVMGEPIK